MTTSDNDDLKALQELARVTHDIKKDINLSKSIVFLYFLVSVLALYLVVKDNSDNIYVAVGMFIIFFIGFPIMSGKIRKNTGFLIYLFAILVCFL